MASMGSVFGTPTGGRITTWTEHHFIPATADVDLRVAVVNAPNEPLRIVSLDTGTR
jgi:hypothetical protein